MKIKKQIKLTPLLSSVIQSIMIITSILLVIIIEESWPSIIAFALIASYLFILTGAVLFSGYDESVYGVCRYRIIKERLSNSDVYYIQTKPILPLFFLFWKGGAYSYFTYQKDDEAYLCKNAFETKNEASSLVEILKSRKEHKKLFFYKKIEICS